MESDDPRSLMRSLGGGALGIGIGFAILAAGFLVSNVALGNAATVAGNAPILVPTLLPSAVAAASPSPTPAATVAPSPTPVPTPTPDPLTAAPYSGQGLRLAALTMPAGYTLRSPLAGTVSIIVYQLLDGEIRSGADVAGAPSFPYIFVRSADREIKIRPGALNRDVQVLVQDGEVILAGAPLLRTVTTGASSWQTFYDRNVTAQVMVSATMRASGAEIDPLTIFSRP